ncbi:hypothetical protein HCU74_17080 [Spongiibacter sp. KMU-166]|uniref:ABC-three component systems C-terminal domain-containing protein n=1 Tax=Spongiibacter thalassae TaxID=2721624 RepID=A0ABX1GIR6_9GAMM|nr:ABC-three component system protein [Spongiibacter thalassae]NKI19124.1 hypothetical protein [Spongiibacter thalassae]
MKKYAYEDMGEDQFESLVVNICTDLFGLGVQAFAKGPDGGRDAKFVGTSAQFPSTASPWKGTTIIQAKHTNGINKSFGDNDFFSPTSTGSVIHKEIPRIQNLKKSKKLDNYIIFSNRRYPAGAGEKICDFISSQCGISKASIFLVGLEQLDSWLKKFPSAAENANLNPIDAPLIVSPDDLSDVVAALANHDFKSIAGSQPPTERIPYATKNKINMMSEPFAKVLRNRYLKDTPIIDSFLNAPENDILRRQYEEVVEEFELKIIAKRTEFQKFDDVYNYIIDLLFSRDPVLSKNRPLTRSMLFYMYWCCDIGSEDATA